MYSCLPDNTSDAPHIYSSCSYILYSPLSPYPTPQYTHTHTYPKRLHILHMRIPSTKYLLPPTQGISHINGCHTLPTTHLPHCRRTTHTVHACIPSPASSLHAHLAQAFTRATPHASSRSRHLRITPPFQGRRLRPPPYQNSKPTSWIKECEGILAARAEKAGVSFPGVTAQFLEVTPRHEAQGG